MTIPRLLILPLLVAAAGCGSSGYTSSSSAAPASKPKPKPAASSSAGSTVSLKADPAGAIKFDTTHLTAKAGTVTIAMTNASQVPHAIAVEGHGVDKDGKVVMGGTSKVTVALKPGTYTFYCPVDGHEKEGMKGTLTVG